jgi:hypothetical protein
LTYRRKGPRPPSEFDCANRSRPDAATSHVTPLASRFRGQPRIRGGEVSADRWHWQFRQVAGATHQPSAAAAGFTLKRFPLGFIRISDHQAIAVYCNVKLALRDVMRLLVVYTRRSSPLAGWTALAQDIDNVVTPDGRKPFSRSSSEIPDQRERAGFLLAFYNERQPTSSQSPGRWRNPF